MNPQAQTQLKTFPVERWKKQLLECFEAPVSVAKYREKRKTHHWLPPHHQLVQQFGSWPAAMSAIFGEDASVYRTNWTAEQIQTAVGQAIQAFDRYPSVTEYDQWHRQHPNTPSVRTIERRFGSYGALMTQLGQTDYTFVKLLSKEETEALLREYFKDPEHPRTFPDYRRYRKERDPNLPSDKTIDRHYGGWRKMLMALGEQSQKSVKPLKPELTAQKKENSLKHVKQLLDQLDPPISSRKYQRKRLEQEHPTDYPSYDQLRQWFGGWPQVLEALGESPNPYQRKTTVELFSREEVEQQIRRYFEQAAHPTQANYLLYAQKKNAKRRRVATQAEIRQYYGGWNPMLATLGLNVCPQAYQTYDQETCLEGLKKAAQYLGLPLTMSKYDKGRQTHPALKQLPARSTLLREFASWKEALEMAGIETGTQRNLLVKEFETPQQSLSAFLDWCLD